MATKIAIVGRPNVGKSTLFNFLTRSRDALIADQPGVTRDRHYGLAEFDDRTLLLTDTGGLCDIEEKNQGIAGVITRQAFLAIDEADLVFWLVDSRDGVTAIDQELADQIRSRSKPVYLLVNKAEGLDADSITAEFHSLGMGVPYAVSAKRGSGIRTLMQKVFEDFPAPEESPEIAHTGPAICVIGRPNVGKSTLINRILGEDRMLTFDQPGTTRDSISIPFSRHDHHYTLIDTAGVRRRARVSEQLEKISILKTMEALEQSSIAVLVIDASEGFTDQDLSLAGLTAEHGKSLILAVNKWDNLEADQKQLVKSQLDRKLGFADYACIHYISALHGTGVGKLFVSIDRIHKVQNAEFKAGQITDLLIQATSEHQPPMVRGRRIKLRYAHIGGHNPFRIIIHGNQTDKVPTAFQRYLSNYYRKALRLTGTPVLIEFRHGDNPFKGRKNTLTKSQQSKRRRMMQHAKRR